MSAAPAKYLFDNDFGPNRDVKPSVSLAEHAQKLKEAETTGYRRGFAEAKIEAEQRTIATLERTAVLLKALDQSLTAVEARIETEAVAVAVAVARKLAPALIEREPLAEITALATDCFRQLVASPHIVVHVNDELHASAHKALEEIVLRLASESRLVVLGDPDIKPGDCRIEWADGGIVRDSAATAAAIEQAVARYVVARTGPSIPEISWRNNK
jgi:flagellar assembly protein FliH